MKPYIELTLNDLRQEAAQLQALIAVLERYGAETADPIPNLEKGSEDTQAADPGPSQPRSPRVIRRRRPAARASSGGGNGDEDQPLGVTELVREACRALVPGFSRVEVIDWIWERYPERKDEIKPMKVDGVLGRFRRTGELETAGEKKGLTGPLICHKLAKE